MGHLSPWWECLFIFGKKFNNQILSLMINNDAPILFSAFLIRSSVMEFRLADFFSEKIIVGPHGVPDPPSLAQMTFTQCTSMSELEIDPGAPPGGQI